jgi:hypothetical protein
MKRKDLDKVEHYTMGIELADPMLCTGIEDLIIIGMTNEEILTRVKKLLDELYSDSKKRAEIIEAGMNNEIIENTEYKIDKN